MLDGSQGAGSIGASQASASQKKHKQSKRNVSVKNTEASNAAYVNDLSPNINHQDQLESKKVSIDKPARNADTSSQGGSQVRVQRKPLNQVDSAASVPVQPQDNDSQLDSSRAAPVKQSGNADRKSKDGLKRKSTVDVAGNSSNA